MGRNIKEHQTDSVQQLLKGFKEELRRHRKRQNELVKNFKVEIREYKKKHPNNINKNFERALRRLQKEDAEKSRWRISSLFKWVRGKNKNNEDISWDNSDSDQSELDENYCRRNKKGKLRSTTTSADAIYFQSDFFEESQDHDFKCVNDTNPAKKGRKRTASEVERNEDSEFCKCKSPKVMRKSPKVVAEQNSCEMVNPENLSLCSTSIDESAFKQKLASTPEVIAYFKELNAKRNKENDAIYSEPGIFIVNMPPPFSCEVKDSVDGKGEVRKKHGKKRIKYWKPKI